MDYTVLDRSPLFRGIPSKNIHEYIRFVPHHIQYFDKEEIIFHLPDELP